MTSAGSEGDRGGLTIEAERSGDARGIGIFDLDPVEFVGDVIPLGECGGDPGFPPDKEVKNGSGAAATSSSSDKVSETDDPREDTEDKVGLDDFVTDCPERRNLHFRR